jgi:hypothetical protein
MQQAHLPQLYLACLLPYTIVFLPTQDWVAKEADGLSRAGWVTIHLNGTMMFNVHIEIRWHTLVVVGHWEMVAAVGCLAGVSICWATASESIVTN